MQRNVENIWLHEACLLITHIICQNWVTTRMSVGQWEYIKHSKYIFFATETVKSLNYTFLEVSAISQNVSIPEEIRHACFATVIEVRSKATFLQWQRFENLSHWAYFTADWWFRVGMKVSFTNAPRDLQRWTVKSDVDVPFVSSVNSGGDRLCPIAL